MEASLGVVYDANKSLGAWDMSAAYTVYHSTVQPPHRATTYAFVLLDDAVGLSVLAATVVSAQEAADAAAAFDEAMQMKDNWALRNVVRVATRLRKDLNMTRVDFFTKLPVVEDASVSDADAAAMGDSSGSRGNAADEFLGNSYPSQAKLMSMFKSPASGATVATGVESVLASTTPASVSTPASVFAPASPAPASSQGTYTTTTYKYEDNGSDSDDAESLAGGMRGEGGDGMTLQDARGMGFPSQTLLGYGSNAATVKLPAGVAKPLDVRAFLAAGGADAAAVAQRANTDKERQAFQDAYAEKHMWVSWGAVWREFARRARAAPHASDGAIRAAMCKDSALARWYAAAAPYLFTLGAARVDQQYTPRGHSRSYNAYRVFTGRQAEDLPERSWHMPAMAHFVLCVQYLVERGVLTTGQAAKEVQPLAVLPPVTFSAKQWNSHRSQP